MRPEGSFMRIRLVAMTLGLLAGTAPFLLAHHSFSAEYDANQPVKVTGVVTKVEWQNPHIWFFVDVKDAQGKVTNWGFSGGPPGVLQRRGISRDALKAGDTVVVEGFRARRVEQCVRREGDLPRRTKRIHCLERGQGSAVGGLSC